MEILLSALAVAFAAFCVWLAVRIINRRERWAKRTLAATIIGSPVLYVLSFGPACWIASRSDSGNAPVMSAVYQPLIWAWLRCPPGGFVQSAATRYVLFGMVESEYPLTLRIPGEGMSIVRHPSPR